MKHPWNGLRLSDVRLTEPVVAIIVLPLNGMYPPLGATAQTTPQEMILPLQQVTLRPDKYTEGGLIRLGETPNDEANCWIDPRNVEIVEVLGRMVASDKGLQCEPIPAHEISALIAKSA